MISAAMRAIAFSPLRCDGRRTRRRQQQQRRRRVGRPRLACRAARSAVGKAERDPSERHRAARGDRALLRAERDSLLVVFARDLRAPARRRSRKSAGIAHLNLHARSGATASQQPCPNCTALTAKEARAARPGPCRAPAEPSSTRRRPHTSLRRPSYREVAVAEQQQHRRPPGSVHAGSLRAPSPRL